MRQLKGTTLDKFPIDDLRKVADLIYFEGPLLVWFETNAGDDYLFYWCDSNETMNRWIVFRVENRKLIDYLDGKVILRDLLLKARDGFVYIADIDGDGDYTNVLLAKPSELPNNYTPSVNSYYEFDPEFAPGRKALTNRDKYRLSIGRQWSLEDLSKFPQKYSVAYSFMYSLRELNRDYIPSERVRKAYTEYPWKGGFSTVNFFRDLNADVLKQHRPQVSSIQYASPGWIEIELLVPVAEILRSVVIATIRNSEELETHYKSTYAFLKEHKIVAEEIKEEQVQKEILEIVVLRYTTIAELMDFQFVERIVEFTKDRITTLKIMLSFYRRVKELSKYQLVGKVTY